MLSTIENEASFDLCVTIIAHIPLVLWGELDLRPSRKLTTMRVRLIRATLSSVIPMDAAIFA